MWVEGPVGGEEGKILGGMTHFGGVNNPPLNFSPPAAVDRTRGKCPALFFGGLIPTPNPPIPQFFPPNPGGARNRLSSGCENWGSPPPSMEQVGSVGLGSPPTPKFWGVVPLPGLRVLGSTPVVPSRPQILAGGVSPTLVVLNVCPCCPLPLPTFRVHPPPRSQTNHVVPRPSFLGFP